MKSVFWWRKSEYPEEKTEYSGFLHQKTDFIIIISDGPSNTHTWWAGPLYKGMAPKENRPNGVLWRRCQEHFNPQIIITGIIHNFIGHPLALKVILVYLNLCTIITPTLVFLIFISLYFTKEEVPHLFRHIVTV